MELHSTNWNEQEIETAKQLPGPILIVGASGFIGAKLFFNLIRLRNDVYAASRNVESSWRLAHSPEEARSFNFVKLDVTDVDQLKSVIGKIRPRTIFNLSAYGAYESQNNSFQIHETNYIGTLNLIKCLQDVGCDAFVHAGSSSEYGINCTAPAESDELVPNSDYAVSKAACSYMLKYYGKFKSFPCVNLRLYSVYGPWEDKGRLIPVLIEKGQKGQFPNFADKNISRDFLYIDDCLSGMVVAALDACKNHSGISINLATGNKHSLEDVANISKEIFSIQGTPEFGTMKNRKWDVSDWYGRIDLANNVLRWKARTYFKEGLELTNQWIKNSSEIVKGAVFFEQKKKITAIIACYKDNQAIPIMYERLTKMFEQTGLNYEIIFVNDCSPNNDEDVIADICNKDHHVVGISHSRNFGSQSAFRSGMEVASGDAVVLMDGDLQDPPEIIPDFIEKWNEGYDIVYGVRIKREAPMYMQFFYKLFYRIFSVLAEVKMPVDAGDFSLIDKRAVGKLIKMPEKDLFLRGLRAWIGYKQTGVEYVRPERMFGKTTNSLLKNIWWAKKGIFSFSIKPLNYIQRVAVSIVIITALLAVFYIVHHFIATDHEAKGITTIILLILGFSGIQLFAISIIGDYIGKILEETKGRPLFIRSKIIKGTTILSSEDQMLQYILKVRKDV